MWQCSFPSFRILYTYSLETGLYDFDKEGHKLRVANLVRDFPNAQGEGFIEFVEISYLDVNPAFEGAAQGHVLKVPEGKDVRVSIPRKLLDKEAFQIWSKYIK